MNPVVHWELFSRDAARLGAFYADLFGWTVQPLADIDYVLLDTRAGSGINGGVLTLPDGPCRPMFYVGVDDLDAALHRVERAGGATTLAPMTEVVRFAQCRDPEGNAVGVLQREDTSLVSPGGAPPVSRFHIASTAPGDLASFYGDAFGWGAAERDGPRPGAAFEVHTGPGGIDGTIAWSPPAEQPVTFYASVGDARDYLARVDALGGRPAEPAGTGPIRPGARYILDPEGQRFGLLAPPPVKGA